MWHELLVAFAMVLIIEGVLPFLHPAGFRTTITALGRLRDGQLRTIGAGSMLLGIIALYIVY